MRKNPTDLAGPDLVVSMDLDPYAPRAARHHVAQVDHPSPDLRDAVTLLTGELVTRAAQQCQTSSENAVELRVWMPADIVRVELRAPLNLLSPLRDGDFLRYGEMLLGQIADRWSIDPDQDFACMWFEIDRREPRGKAEPEPNQHRDARQVRSRLRRAGRRDPWWHHPPRSGLGASRRSI